MPEGRVLYISYDGVLEPVAQSQAISYVMGLSQKGFKFWVLSFEKTQNLSDTGYVDQFDSELKNKGITWLRMRYHSKPKMLSTFFDVLAGIFFCLPVIAKNKINIIHARAEVPSAMAFVLSRIFRTKFIYDRRGILAHDYVDGGMWPRESRMTKLMFRFVNALDRKFLLSADHIVVLTNKIAGIVRDELLALRPGKEPDIKVIPCCTDLERFKPRTGDLPEDPGLQGKFVLMYAGCLGTWYMLDEMVDFYIHLKAVKKNAHFLIATLSDKNIAERVLLAKGLTGSDYTLTGRKHKDMPGLIASADAAVMFIKPVYSKIASCPTKFGEFLASGVPIVINRGIGDTEEVLDKNSAGVVVKAFTPDDYRDCALRLLKLNDEGPALKKRCRDTAEKYFSLDSGVDKYLEIYEKLCR